MVKLQGPQAGEEEDETKLSASRFMWMYKNKFILH